MFLKAIQSIFEYDFSFKKALQYYFYNSKKDEELAEQTIKQNELKLEIESLKALLNQKNTDRRNLIQKEYGYDNALLTLQNDLNDLESKLALTKRRAIFYETNQTFFSEI